MNELLRWKLGSRFYVLGLFVLSYSKILNISIRMASTKHAFRIPAQRVVKLIKDVNMVDAQETKEEQRQLKSLDQLQDWSKWMVGYELIALGFSTTSYLKESELFPAIILFATLTILLAAWVLSSIPSVTRRVEPGKKYHTYSLYNYEWIKKIKLTLDKVAIAQHVCFAITVILIGLSLCDV